MKKLYTILLLIVSAMPVWAKWSVSGNVVSQTEGSVVEMATIRLFSYNNSDSVLVQGAQSDLSGHFLLTDIANGHYKLWISSIGFISQCKDIVVASKDVNAGTWKLIEDIQTLSEIKVSGKAAEMTIKGDTIEYNTAAYKVSENATMEDLLKKMNGITVDQQGNVTVNGENITAIRIDGKKFFGNDVQSATKNIPADMIEKVQVIDEKSEMAKLTGFEDDESEHIINLTLKQDKQRGVFGNYTGGLGLDLIANNGKWFGYDKQFFSNDFRYNANLFTNLLLGDNQTTIIGGANNTNEMRSGRGRGSMGQNANSGITWSENIGVNTNVDWTKKCRQIDNSSSLLFGGDVAFNHAYNDIQTQAGKTSYTGDATYQQDESSKQQAHTMDVNLRLELDYQIDTLNKIIIQPGINYTTSNKIGQDDYSYYRQDETQNSLINQGSQAKIDSSRNIGAQIIVTYSHKFIKPGRSLTIQANTNYSNSLGYNQTLATGTNPLNQHTHSTNNNLSYKLRTSYVEPLGKPNHLLELTATFSGQDRWKQKDQYTWNESEQDYLYDDTYSNHIINHTYNEELMVNYRWVEQKSDLTVGLRGLLTQTISQTHYGSSLIQDTTIYGWNLAPNVKFRYKFGKKEFLRINYRGQMKYPTLSQLSPVRDNSNAMRESVGNLALLPSYSHNLNLMYSRFNQERFSSITASLRGQLTQDALVNNTIYDQTGKRYQQTVNAPIEPWSLNGDLMYNTPFANKMLQLNSRTSIGYQQQISYVLREQDAATISRLIEQSELLLGDLSSTGRMNLSQDLSLRFVHEIVDVGVRGNVLYSRTHNNLSNAVSNVLNWSVTGDIAFHLPRNWNIKADCGYTARLGYTGLDQTNEVLLNAAIEKTWTNATLALTAYDLLQQKKNIVQVVEDNSISYEKYNTLPTYLMLTFTYKLNKMGDLKAKGEAGRIQDRIEKGNSSKMF